MGMCLALTGCVGLRVGRPIPEQAVEFVRPGFSTRDDVAGLLGRPLRVVPGEGGEIWVYRYMDGRTTVQELIIGFGDHRVSTVAYR